MPAPLRALLAALALALAACSSGPTESATPPAEEPASTETTAAPATVAPTTTTTAPPATPPPTTAPPPPQPVAGGPLPKALLTATGVTVPVLAREGDALRVGTPCGATALLGSGTPVDGTVVLDAGHGGVEPGAVGPAGLSEKELNLAVTGHAKAALERAGVQVVLTRPGDYRVTLEARAKIVHAVKPRAFVSIHHNAEPDGPFPKPGAETYYQTVGDSAGESKRLSGLVYEEIVRALSQYEGVTWVADTDAGAKYRKSGSGDDYYGILRRTQGVPATLAELAFVSNPPEEALLARADVPKVEGEAVAQGILRFLRTQDPGSGFTEPYPREAPAGGGGGASNCKDPVLA